jgi:hypothetical protein
MSKTVVYNKSKTYLLPLLSEFIEFDFKFMNCLDNTYMYADVEGYENHFFIEHSFDFGSPEFVAYESKLENNELFVEYIDIGDKVLYIFKFPEDYLHEYNCLINGRYSAFGVDAKELILKFWNTVYAEDITAVFTLLKIKQILFKDEKLRKQLEKELSSPKAPIIIDEDAELGSFVYKEQETFELSAHIKK